MTEDRNPESQRDLALRLISRRADPTAFRPAGGGMNPLQALEWLGREGIREPLSTAVSYASLSEADARAKRDGAPWWSRALSGLKEPVDWFNTDRWREASGIAQNRSLGQSVMLAPLTSNIRDPAEVAAARESRWYRKGSGAVDLAARVTVDPNAVLGGQTIRAMIADTARRGGPAAAAGIRSAAGQNRLGLRDPGRWIGEVDPPDAPLGGLRVIGRTSTTPRFNTPQYLDEVRAARPETVARTTAEREPTHLRQNRQGVWRDAILRRAPVLEDGYVIPMEKTDVLDIINDVQTNISRPARGVLVQLDEAGQIVGNPIRAVGDRTPLDEIGLVGHDTPVSPNWITDSRRAGWWWVHADSAQPSSPHSQIIGLDDLESRAFKVAMTGDEVAASKVDDLLERFDSMLPDDEWNTFQVPVTMKGGVFKGTAVEGKTLAEIGEMAGRSHLPIAVTGTARQAEVAAANTLSPAEVDAIWPTVARMYADEAVDNILTARDDMDTMRLRALFYDDPAMAGDQTAHSAIVDFVDRGSYRSGGGDMGLPGWISIPTKESRVLEIRDLVVADLREVTRKFVDDVGMPERVSVGRWQTPGERIGASGTTFPMDPQWGTQVTTGYRPLTDLGAPLSQRYGTSGPSMGGSGQKWIEAVVDPRKDIDFFMLSRTGHNWNEHEILMSPLKWSEKAVGGLTDEAIPGGWSRHTTGMPGLTSSQIEFGPNAPKWMQRALDELEAAGTEPDLLNRYLTAPAGRTREALANRVRSEINVGRRNLLEAEGWTNLPTPGAIRTYGPGGRTLDNLNVRDAFDQIVSGKYDATDWLRFGSDPTLPAPPNWYEFMDEVHDLAGTRRVLLDEGSRQAQSGVDFTDWLLLRGFGLVSRSVTTLKGERMYPGIRDGIVGWTVKEGAPAGKATMELVPGWRDTLADLVDIWGDNPKMALL